MGFAPSTELKGSKFLPTQKFLSFHPLQDDDKFVIRIFFFSHGAKKKYPASDFLEEGLYRWQTSSTDGSVSNHILHRMCIPAIIL